MNVDVWATAGSINHSWKGSGWRRGIIISVYIRYQIISKYFERASVGQWCRQIRGPTTTCSLTQVKLRSNDVLKREHSKSLLLKMFRPQALQSTSTYKKISRWLNFQPNLCEMEPMRVLEMGQQRGKYYIRNQAGVLLCCTVRPVFMHRQKKD